jgi:hypothetical protein
LDDKNEDFAVLRSKILYITKSAIMLDGLYNLVLKRKKANLKSDVIGEYCKKLLHQENKLPPPRVIDLCNILLLIDSKDRSLIRKKIRVLNAFQGKDEETEELTLNHIITETRLTKDTSYLQYRAKRYIDSMDWEKALYSIEAILTYEPENEEFIALKKKALESCKKYVLCEKIEFDMPKDEIIVVDANIWIFKIFKDVKTMDGDFFLEAERHADTEMLFSKYSNNNRVIVLPTTIDEINTHLKIRKMNIEKTCMKGRFGSVGFKKIAAELDSRMDYFIKKYNTVKDVTYGYYDMESIRNFFHDRLRALEKVTLWKISSADRSFSIKKLVQREGYLPELNDRKLLSEAISVMKKTGKEVGILTYDSDFTTFARDIYERFKIKVYNAEENRY